MAQVLELDLRSGDYIFAWLEKFTIFSGSQTLSGVEFTFEFEIHGSDKAKECNLTLQQVEIDVSVFVDSQRFYVGRLRESLSTPTLLNYKKNIQQKLEISHNAYWKFVDLTHKNDLELNFNVKASATIEANNEEKPIILSGEKRGVFPQSEWLKILNRGNFDRFEIITLRTTLPPLGKYKDTYDEAFNKLREAQNCFYRGDWNSVGSQCRAAWRVIKTLIPKRQQPQAIELLLASITGDPRRKEFGDAVVKGANNILNKATHLEGDSATQIPPSDLQREDALLCLHWTAATISYIASVYQ